MMESLPSQRKVSTFLRSSHTLIFCISITAGVFANVSPAQTQSNAHPSASESKSGVPQLSGPYLTWLDKHVRWIITPQERSAYLALQSNPERLRFIKEFWQRRNPDPARAENRFKDEHYRRIEYANTHFATTHPGSMSDRGRIYIVYGIPDSIRSFPSGGNGETRPFEIWHYSRLRGDKSALSGVDIEFVDFCRCGDYKLSSPPEI